MNAPVCVKCGNPESWWVHATKEYPTAHPFTPAPPPPEERESLIVSRIDQNTAHIVALEKAVLAAGIKIEYPPPPEEKCPNTEHWIPPHCQPDGTTCKTYPPAPAAPQEVGKYNPRTRSYEYTTSLGTDPENGHKVYESKPAAAIRCRICWRTKDAPHNDRDHPFSPPKPDKPAAAFFDASNRTGEPARPDPEKIRGVMTPAAAGERAEMLDAMREAYYDLHGPCVEGNEKGCNKGIADPMRREAAIRLGAALRKFGVKP